MLSPRSSVRVALPLLLSTLLAASAVAQAPTEVDVVNDASTPVSVTLDNQVIDVFVDNEESEPIPVAVRSTPGEVPILILLQEWEPTLADDTLRIADIHEICIGAQAVCDNPFGDYRVPDDKVLVIESVSISARVHTGTAPSLMAADISIQPQGSVEFVFAMGRAELVYPHRKVYQTNFTGKLRAAAGSKVRAGVFWSSNVAGASAGVTISGVLQDAPLAPEGNSDLVAKGDLPTGDLEPVDAQRLE